jgi:hypothetical protein
MLHCPTYMVHPPPPPKKKNGISQLDPLSTDLRWTQNRQLAYPCNTSLAMSPKTRREPKARRRQRCDDSKSEWSSMIPSLSLLWVCYGHGASQTQDSPTAGTRERLRSHIASKHFPSYIANYEPCKQGPPPLHCNHSKDAQLTIP